MLLKNDLDTFEVQDFCAETLYSSIDYQTFCVGLVGEVLNYETDSRIDSTDHLPNFPYCMVFAGEEKQDTRMEEWGHYYEIGFAFGIEDEKTSLIENGVKKYQESRTVEKLAKKAIVILKERLRSHGISGDYEIDIVEANGEKTPTGDADSIEYNLILTFAYLDDINK